MNQYEPPTNAEIWEEFVDEDQRTDRPAQGSRKTAEIVAARLGVSFETVWAALSTKRPKRNRPDER
jgi:hypothetical protein